MLRDEEVDDKDKDKDKDHDKDEKAEAVVVTWHGTRKWFFLSVMLAGPHAKRPRARAKAHWCGEG